MHLRLLIALLLSPCLLNLAGAQEIVDFQLDVQPILKARCLSCHGPDEAKNDFRVDDADSMADYIEAGDVESSSLWADYLITDDEEMKMPPVTPENPTGMTAAELATVKLWIEEGANFDWQAETPVDNIPVEAPPEMSTAYKLWLFQGLFHPASTHFPIALLSISMAFLLVSFFAGKSFETAAYYCLCCGALAAVGACVMGWAYATDEGYVGLSFDLANSNIARHRWLGILVAIGALVLIPFARTTVKSEEGKMKSIWLIGALVIGLGVSIVGYQGGELTYGEDHYAKEFNRLFDLDEKPTEEKADADPATAEEEAPAEDSE
ncbi:c-type cytochrome domain-containing protein [Bremerella cremea]|nr:c-type cytochrome domain-containing protein [Bremerella cremea]